MLYPAILLNLNYKSPPTIFKYQTFKFIPPPILSKFSDFPLFFSLPLELSIIVTIIVLVVIVKI